MQGTLKDPRFPTEMKRKYPKHLIPVNGPMNKMVDKGLFYFWTVEPQKSRLVFFLALVVIIVIAFMLFNIWPLWLKIALWYFSFYLLMLLVILLVINYALAWNHCREGLCLPLLLAPGLRYLDLPQLLQRHSKYLCIIVSIG